MASGASRGASIGSDRPSPRAAVSGSGPCRSPRAPRRRSCPRRPRAGTRAAAPGSGASSFVRQSSWRVGRNRGIDADVAGEVRVLSFSSLRAELNTTSCPARAKSVPSLPPIRPEPRMPTRISEARPLLEVLRVPRALHLDLRRGAVDRAELGGRELFGGRAIERGHSAAGSKRRARRTHGKWWPYNARAFDVVSDDLHLVSDRNEREVAGGSLDPNPGAAESGRRGSCRICRQLRPAPPKPSACRPSMESTH